MQGPETKQNAPFRTNDIFERRDHPDLFASGKLLPCLDDIERIKRQDLGHSGDSTRSELILERQREG